MRKLYKLGITLCFALTFALSLFAQNNFFTDEGQNRAIQTTGQRAINPDQYRASQMNVQAMKDFLWSLPSEQNVMNRNLAPIMMLPMPNGTMAKFRVWESSIQEPALAAKFPEIRTFAGQGIDDPAASVRFDYNPYFGFSAQILSPNGRVLIDPYARFNNQYYQSYYTKELPSRSNFICNSDDGPNRPEAINAGPCRGTQLYTYRLAVACTGEYAAVVGGGGANPTHAAIVTAVNRVSGVYELEVSVRLILIANNDQIEFLDGLTDPYNNSGGSGELNTNQTTIDNIIGPANYDIGHLFCSSNGGVAQLSSVCGSGKARGLTGLPNPVGDAFYIDYVAHEMGHQFGGRHTFNSQTGSCSGGNRSAATAYEVGSGTTIQAYAGICGTDNTQPNSDPFFHTVSFDEISNFVEAGGALCRTVIPNGNTLPVITAMDNNGANIPLNTPFTLTGSATDANGDLITYCWEEWDLGPATTWNGGNANTTSPLFKSRIPKTSGSRTFPDMAVILAGYPANPAATMGGLKGETLPTQARTLKFRLTVRDNRAGGGGVVTGGDGCQAGFTSMFQIQTIAATGPFVVNVPNGGESYQSGTVQTVSWNVGGTDLAPISTANVRITMSTDGGLTYPIELLASTANDGSESVTFPLITTTTARVRIEAVGNIYFDISNGNFTLTPPPSGFDFSSPAPAVSACPAAASMAIVLGTTSIGGFTNPISLSATGNPAGTTVSFSPNPVTPGNNTTVTLTGTNTLGAGNYVITVTGTATGATTRTRDITFTINPGAGPAITVQPPNQTICVGANTTFTVTSATATSFQWQVSTDGGTNYTNVTNGGVYSGAQTATLTITGATAGMNTYRYRVIASVQCGSTTSTAGILTVNTAPAITTSPQSVTLCAGGTNTFTSAATGSGLTYQWELSTNGCAGPWAPIAAATSSSYTIGTITVGMNNTGYRVVVSGACAPPATSACALLTVVTSVSVTQQPANATVCVGANTSFTVAGSGTGVIYQWQVSTDGGANYVNVTNTGVYSGAQTGTLTITGATANMTGYMYRAQLSNSTCTTPGVSNAATLTVNTLPTITTNPPNRTICLGGNTTFTGAATATGLAYQWQVSTDGGANYTNITNGGVYAGATTNTLAVNGVTAAMHNYRYRFVATGVCPPAANSTGAILTVINPVSIAAAGQPANAEVCSGSPATFTVTGTSVEPITYQWQDSTSAHTWQNIAGATASSYTVANTTTAMSGNKYRVLVNNNTCTSPTTSNAATLTVRQLPTVTLTATTTSLLPGQSTTLTATPSASTGGTLSTSWTFNNNPLLVTGNTYIANIEKVGNYRVSIQETWPSGLICSNQSAVLTIEAEVSTRLFIFPSPNDGRFTVSYYNSNTANTSRTVTVYDSKGAKVYHAKFNITGAYTLLPINIQTASRGVYHVVIGDADGKRITKGSVVVN